MDAAMHSKYMHSDIQIFVASMVPSISFWNGPRNAMHALSCMQGKELMSSLLKSTGSPKFNPAVQNSWTLSGREFVFE